MVLSKQPKGVLSAGIGMRLSKQEVIAWALVALSIVSLNAARYGSPIVSDDSFQYMSIAENLAQGNGIRTSIVHFDQERSHGELPAPVTWFPPGYPALIALVMLAGVSALWAGFLVSSISLCVLIPITLWLCRWYGLSLPASRLVVFCLIANGTAITFSSAVVTEPLFTAFSTASMAMLLAASSESRKEQPGRGLGLWALCGLSMGLSCWVRYAGLFLFISVAFYLALDVVLRRRQNLRGPFLALATAALPIAVLLGRNLYLVGDWRGGNSKETLRSGLEVGKQLVVSVYRLFFGAIRADRLGVAEFLLAFVGAACAFVVLRSLLQHRERVAGELKDRPGLLPLATYLAVYMGMMLLVAFSAPPALTARLCYPLLPLVLVLVGLLVTLAAPSEGDSHSHRLSRLPASREAADSLEARKVVTVPPRARAVPIRAAARPEGVFPQPRMVVASALTVVVGYVFLNVRDTLRPAFSDSVFLNRRVSEFLEAPTPSGEPLKTWVQSNIPAGANIVATFGLATGHVLRRKTVSLVGSEYSTQEWDEPHLRDLMLQFHADFLILYPETSTHPAPDVQKESPFLSSLARGEDPPDWLRRVARNPHIMVLQRIAFADDRFSARRGESGQETVLRSVEIVKSIDDFEARSGGG